MSRQPFPTPFRALFLTAFAAFPTLARAQPANDNCSSPMAISGNGTFAFDLTNATTGPQGQNNQNCNSPVGTSILNDIWYCWTANCSGLVAITTCSLTNVD